MAFQLTDEYPPFPRSLGVCFTCGAAKRADERLVDLGVMTDTIEELDGQIHSYKIPVLCEACIVELANLIGCLDQEASRRLRSELTQAQQAVKAARAELDTLKELVRGVTV